APYVFLSPFVLLFFVFGLFPLCFSLYLAFQSWEPTSGLDSMVFVGFDNYAFALRDEWFWKSLRNTGWLALASGVPHCRPHRRQAQYRRASRCRPGQHAWRRPQFAQIHVGSASRNRAP
ncbi:carbohydrate ABC transporter permease, partial [Roseateles sp. GG27B]